MTLSALLPPSLSVAYRASQDPQEIWVDVHVPRPPAAPFAHVAMKTFVDAVNSGAAGGSTFSPTLGFAEIKSGPRDDADARGTRYTWVVRVAAVAPLFIRTFVDELMLSGMGQPTTVITIAGTLPVDASPLSVREGLVRSWLADGRSYVDAWPTPGFPLLPGDRGPGDDQASLRLLIDAPIDRALRFQLEELAVNWLNVIHCYVGHDGQEVSFNPHKTLPAFGQGKTEFRAWYPELPFAPEPARAVMINMLSRFHATVAPILEAEIGV